MPPPFPLAQLVVDDRDRYRLDGTRYIYIGDPPKPSTIVVTPIDTQQDKCEEESKPNTYGVIVILGVLLLAHRLWR